MSSRRKVGGVYVELETLWWGVLLSAEGTRDDLIAAGIAHDYMFEGMPKHGRTHCDEHGNRFDIRKRAGGRFKLVRCLADEPSIPHGWKNRPVFDPMPRVLEIRDSGGKADEAEQRTTGGNANG